MFRVICCVRARQQNKNDADKSKREEISRPETSGTTQQKSSSAFYPYGAGANLLDWSHSLITFIRYFSELVPIFMGNHSLCRISGFEIEDQPLTLSTLEFLLMDQVDFRYPLLGGVEPVMITSLLSS